MAFRSPTSKTPTAGYLMREEEIAVSKQRWIEVVGWDTFQHYRKRRPVWIKNYTALLLNDAYRGLTGPQRGLLHGLWILYAGSDGLVALDLKMLNRLLGLSVKMETLEALNDAGFIRFRARRPLALHARAIETETEIKRSKTTAKNDQPELLSFPEYLAGLEGKAKA